MSEKIKSQVLIFSLFLVIFISLLSLGLLHRWQSLVELDSIQGAALQALYLAQAGAERGKIELLENVNLQGLCPDTANPDCPSFTDATGYTELDPAPGSGIKLYYRFQIDNQGGDDRRIFGQGEVQDVDGNRLAFRQIRIDVRNIEDDEAPYDGQDEDYQGRYDYWAWREPDL